MIEASFEAVVPKAINAEFEAIIPREKAFDIVNKDIHIDTNGRYEVKADAGTAMTQVNVEVDIQPKEFKDVNFYDYEGTILHSYTWDEFVEKNEMPPLPTHREKEGLICQEWNYTLDEVLEQGGRCDVGAIYIPEDGNTHIKCTTIGKTKISISYNYSSNVVIDWGDGVIEDVVNTNSQSSVTHTYDNSGTYEIIISGNIKLINGNKCFLLPAVCIQELYIGVNTLLMPYALTGAQSIKYVTLSNNQHFLAYTFQGCGIEHINLPPNIMDLATFALGDTSSKIKSISLPPRFSSQSVTEGLNFLTSIFLPKNVLYNLADPYILKDVSVSAAHNKYTQIGKNIYEGTILKKGLDGMIADGTTEIGLRAYRRCLFVQSLNIPESVRVLNDGAFQWAENISTPIKIPNRVTSIGIYCFYYCALVPYFDFREVETIPTLSNTNAFTGIPATCKIVVPDALYDQWIVATNWATYASRIVKASEFVEPTNE